MRGIVLLMLLCLSFPVTSQESESMTINAWVELGTFRITPVKYDRSAGVDIALKCQVNRILTTVQYHDCFDSEETDGYFEIFTSDNHYHAGNLLVGITNKQCLFGHVSISSGMGLFWGTFENQGIERFATIGLPVEAAASINLFPFAGINVKVFSNLNARHSFIGFGMDLQLGKMRDIGLNELIPSL